MNNTFIDLAIQREVEAYDFYMDLYNRVSDSTAKEALKWIAGEEKKHEEFLRNYKEGKITSGTAKISEVDDHKIAEHVSAPEVKPQMDSKEVYLIAAHRELAAHTFYTEFAKLQTDSETKNLILKIANEELKHKEKVEYLYSNTAFSQTEGG
jgi:rubrerythrin